MTEALNQAKATLEVTIEIAKNNAPINEAEGNLEQAALERQTAEECQSAVDILNIDLELSALEREMRDSQSDYFKGPYALGKQERYRALVKVKEALLSGSKK